MGISAMILMFSLLVFGCVEKPADHSLTKGNDSMEENAQVTLQASISTQNGILTVEYRVKNKSQGPIYVFNRLWEFGPDGQYAPAPQESYSTLGDNGTLHLVAGIPALPKTKRVELKIVPFTTRVDAGQELSEKFELREPIAEYNPYFPNEKKDSTELKDSDSIFLSVDYVSETEGLQVKPSPLENALSVWHQSLAEKVRRLSTQPKASLVKVNRRTDPFERF